MSEPLTCFLEGLTPPSMNSLLSVYCVGNRPRLEMKAEVRLFRLKLTQQLPRWDCPKDTPLQITLSFHQSWHYKNGKPKHQDVPNLIKCVLDTLAARYRFSDSFATVRKLTCKGVEDGRVGIGIAIEHEAAS